MLSIFRADMEYHLTQCSGALKKKGGENVRALEDIEPKKTVKKTGNFAAFNIDTDDEDWDKEMEGLNLGTYNPMVKVVENNIPVNFNANLINKSGRRDLRSLQRIGDKDGVGQLVNEGGYGHSGSGPEVSRLPVGMIASPLGQKKKKKKQAS